MKKHEKGWNNYGNISQRENQVNSFNDSWVVKPLRIHHFGRFIDIPHYHNRIVKMSFQELCLQPFGPSDYLEMVKHIDLLLLTDIPVMTLKNRNEARRFITLLDVLYDMKIKTIFSAQVQPQELLCDQSEKDEELFAFNRAISRLMEMQNNQVMKR
jgi:cell division protein ZapE